MQKIINETEIIAFSHLKAFGFKEEQISSLVAQGKKDLACELGKLELLLQEDTVSLEDIDNILHALKGLLFQLGNHSIAEKLNESRSHLEDKETLDEIVQILFDKEA